MEYSDSYPYKYGQFKKEKKCEKCFKKDWKCYQMVVITVPMTNTAILALGQTILFYLRNFTKHDYVHGAVIFSFICKCNKKFRYTYELFECGTKPNFGSYHRIFTKKMKRAGLWLSYKDMENVFANFEHKDGSRYDVLKYNCQHFANELYDAILQLDRSSANQEEQAFINAANLL